MPIHKFNKISVLSYSMNIKEQFFKVYSNLPLNERDKVVLVLDGEPISWNVAYQQIKNDTTVSLLCCMTLHKQHSSC